MSRVIHIVEFYDVIGEEWILENAVNCFQFYMILMDL